MAAPNLHLCACTERRRRARHVLGARGGHAPWAGPTALGRGRPGHLGTVQPSSDSCWPGQQAGLACVGWAIEAAFGPWRRR
jgi:hypothetical protein